MRLPGSPDAWEGIKGIGKGYLEAGKTAAAGAKMVKEKAAMKRRYGTKERARMSRLRARGVVE